MCCKNIVQIFIVISKVICCASLGIFHENTKITFHADEIADYFGFTVLLNETALYVGAPKARSRNNRSISPGLVFSCPIDTLDMSNVTCRPYGNEVTSSRFVTRSSYIKDDMWFGAVISMIPTGKLLICAPRWTVPYKTTHYLANGICYIHGKRRGQWVLPLQDMSRQAYVVNGKRKEYGEYGVHLNLYAYGQAGMSAKVTEANTLIIGAPGLLQWTGGISEYMLYPDYKAQSVQFGLRTTTNPYNTREVGPDEYLGYSVDSGKFDSTGKTLYVAGAPRSKAGYGQVFIFEQSFRENDPLNIKAKVYGPHLGSYFGASICCVDVNGDGVVDLLVGAPTYVEKGGGLPYDQGAVFVYLTVRKNSTFDLKEAGFVTGSKKSGARFGTAIAELGDVDGDGFIDIAVGAPWENDGRGAVYVYGGSATGLKASYLQKIFAEDAKAFGISISKGIDIDNNDCNDLAVGAYETGTAYILRCIPTMQVVTKINIPNTMDLPLNVTNFTALFCIDAPLKAKWSHVRIDLAANVVIDPEDHRAAISGDSVYNITVKPGYSACEEQTIDVLPTADLSKPISIKFSLIPLELMKDDSVVFVRNAARLSSDSVLQTDVDIQLTRDCGEDLICRPLLTMNWEPLVNPYVPGSDDRLGFTIEVLNKEEPAYGAKVYLQLPSNPKRLPSDCMLEELNITCKIPSPLLRGQSILWNIELEPTLKGIVDKELKVLAMLEDAFHKNKNQSHYEELKIAVAPKANFSISGKALPNNSITITRDRFDEAGSVNFVHYYEVTNYGPSDWYRLSASLVIPEQVNLSSPIKGCLADNNKTECTWSLPAKVSMPIILPLRFDVGMYKKYFEETNTINITSEVVLLLEDRLQSVKTTTTLILDPPPPLWPLIVGSVAGFTLLAAIVFGLYKYGFFSRKSRDELKRQKEQSLLLEEPGTSACDPDELIQELVPDD